jgi:H+/gluconate symporter-like permease
MSLPGALAIVAILSFPIVLIIAAGIVEQFVLSSLPAELAKSEQSAALADALKNAALPQQIITFLGHPVIALLISTCAALYFLGRKRGVSGDELMTLSTKALGPAGIIILVTGAGGVFKKMLGTSGVGDALANLLEGAGLSAVLLAWLFSTILRVAQGSATVAMLGAAALMGSIVAAADFSHGQLALIVVSIAAGATGFSHVNDSGFWIISRYFYMSEKETLKTWFFVGTTISIVGLLMCLALWPLV